MKKIFLILLVIGLNIGCSSPVNNSHEDETTEAEHVCNCQQRDKVAEFIQSSIKNANNMSDEEMEDVITELRRTAVKIHCPLKNVTAIRDDFHHIKKLTQPLDSCEQIMEY